MKQAYELTQILHLKKFNSEPYILQFRILSVWPILLILVLCIHTKNYKDQYMKQN